MVKLWRRYKPFINAGVQELITYRVNFILYRIGDVMGAFVAFYLWKAVFDSSQDSLIQGFSMADITLYIIMSFVTNLLTRSDGSFMIGEEVKDGSIIMRLLRPVHFAASYLFTELGSKWLIFISVGLPFLSVIVLMKILSGQGIVEVLGLTVLYLFSLTLAYLINFFFNICFGFSAFVFKNLWGSNLLKNSMEVDYDGNPDTLKQISDAVSKAGYEATPRSDKKDSAATTKADATDASEKAVKQKRIELISSMAFAIPLFYLAMGEMMGAPVPPAVSGMNGMMNLALTELLLCIPILFIYVVNFCLYLGLFKLFREYLLKNGHSVINVDNFDDFYHENQELLTNHQTHDTQPNLF